MAKLSTDELLDAFKEMTLIELSEFVKQFEEVFNVTAAAPVAVAAAGAPAGGGEAAAEKGRVRRHSRRRRTKKIQVIKEVRALTSLGLGEAKELVESAPKPILEKANKEDADKAKEALEAVRRHRQRQVVAGSLSQTPRCCRFETKSGSETATPWGFSYCRDRCSHINRRR